MFAFEMCLLVMAIVLLIGFIAFMDAVCNGLHVPHEPPIDWPQGHELYRYERRSWRAKRQEQ